MTQLPFAAIEAVAGLGGAMPATSPAVGRPAATSFSQVLLNGVEQVNQKQIEADALVQAFALDGSIPVHQVTFALEQARLSLELALQVRARLVEGYQELMRMQL